MMVHLVDATTTLLAMVDLVAAPDTFQIEALLSWTFLLGHELVLDEIAVIFKLLFERQKVGRFDYAGV